MSGRQACHPAMAAGPAKGQLSPHLARHSVFLVDADRGGVSALATPCERNAKVARDAAARSPLSVAGSSDALQAPSWLPEKLERQKDQVCHPCCAQAQHWGNIALQHRFVVYLLLHSHF